MIATSFLIFTYIYTNRIGFSFSLRVLKPFATKWMGFHMVRVYIMHTRAASSHPSSYVFFFTLRYILLTNIAMFQAVLG